MLFLPFLLCLSFTASTFLLLYYPTFYFAFIFSQVRLSLAGSYLYCSFYPFSNLLPCSHTFLPLLSKLFNLCPNFIPLLFTRVNTCIAFLFRCFLLPTPLSPPPWQYVHLVPFVCHWRLREKIVLEKMILNKEEAKCSLGLSVWLTSSISISCCLFKLQYPLPFFSRSLPALIQFNIQRQEGEGRDEYWGN